jgi:hypothetical protein
MKNILVKGSGDVMDRGEFFKFVVDKAEENYTVLIPGAGTKISIALKEAGYDIMFDKLGRRVTKTWRERIIMRNILEQEQVRLEEKFVGKGVVILPPILYAGSVLCPINGDDLVRAYELGFDEIYVFTTGDRVEKKRITFQDYPTITVIGI